MPPPATVPCSSASVSLPEFFESGRKGKKRWLTGGFHANAFAPTLWLEGPPPLLKAGTGVAFAAYQLAVPPPGKAGYNYKAYSKQLVSDAYQQQIYGKYGVVSSITGQLVNGNTDMFSPGVGALQVRRPTLQ